MAKKINLAIVGATGAVGQMLLTILAERHFPVGELYLLASARSAGKKIQFQNQAYTVSDLADFDFSKVQLAFFAAGSSVAKQYAPRAVQAGCTVIDKSSYFRYQDDVPLVVPEVNGSVLKNLSLPHIIATPNCSTTQMLVALKPIYDAVSISRINVCTYQAVSGTGIAGMDELEQQAMAWNEQEEQVVKTYRHQIAFNVLPHIDDFMDNGYTKEEMKMVWETQKIFADKTIEVNPTTVRVPVFNGHSEAVHIETRKKITVAEAKALLSKAPGVQLCEADQDYPTALTHAEQNDNVFVGRVRQDISHPNGLNLWIVANNLRKGAALNAVQIAELLHFS